MLLLYILVALLLLPLVLAVATCALGTIGVALYEVAVLPWWHLLYKCKVPGVPKPPSSMGMDI